jgi:hypothetical protein
MNDTNEYLFLSEYQGSNKSAWVCQNRQTRAYTAIGYAAGVEQLKESFDSESDAEDWAEDWVLLNTPQ